LALRLALAATYADSNAPANEILAEIGPGRGGLTRVLLAASDLLDELAGAERIEAMLAAELDDAAGPAA